MKKTLSTLVLLTLIVPIMVSAQTAPMEQCIISHDLSEFTSLNCPNDGDPCVFDDNSDCGMCCLLNTIKTITNWIFFILITLVGIMIVWGGINIVTAAGDPEKVKSGKSYIVYAAIGLAVALLAQAIPSIVGALLGA